MVGLLEANLMLRRVPVQVHGGFRLTQNKTQEDRHATRHRAVATLAVKDLGTAARFYEETLGLSRAGAEDDEAIVFESGNTTINVYRSSFAGTNNATALTWTVDDVEDVVRTLKAKGVEFEHYDLPDTRREGDVHSGNIKE